MKNHKSSILASLTQTIAYWGFRLKLPIHIETFYKEGSTYRRKLKLNDYFDFKIK